MTGTTSPRTSWTRRSASCRTSTRRSPAKPFFLYFATGATHAPDHAPREYIDRYAGRFDDGWDLWRDAAFARQRSSGVVPDGTTLTPRPSWVDAWGDLTGDERRLFAPADGVLRRVPHPHRRAARPPVRVPRGPRRPRRHARAPLLGQRDERRGRSVRLAERASLHAPAPRRPGRHARAASTTSEGSAVQPLSVGLGVGRQHAAAAVEALQLARRGAHAAAGALAGRGSGHRHRCARSSATPSTSSRRCSTRSGSTRPPSSTASTRARSPAPACCRRSPTRAAPSPTRHAVLRDDRLPGDRTRTGWKATTDHVGNQLDVERDRARGQPRLRHRPLAALQPRRGLLGGP